MEGKKKHLNFCRIQIQCPIAKIKRCLNFQTRHDCCSQNVTLAPPKVAIILQLEKMHCAIVCAISRDMKGIWTSDYKPKPSFKKRLIISPCSIGWIICVLSYYLPWNMKNNEKKIQVCRTWIFSNVWNRP